MDQDSLTECLVSGYAWVILHYHMFSAILEPQQSTQYEFIVLSDFSLIFLLIIQSCRGHAWPTSQVGRGLTIYGVLYVWYPPPHIAHTCGTVLYKHHTHTNICLYPQYHLPRSVLCEKQQEHLIWAPLSVLKGHSMEKQYFGIFPHLMGF